MLIIKKNTDKTRVMQTAVP